MIASLFITQTTILLHKEVEGSPSVSSNDSELLFGGGSNDIVRSTSHSSSSITNLQAKNTQQSIYNCAVGEKGVIISPGSFDISAKKKNGKWNGTISITGSTGMKSGHINSDISKGISFSFKGNLDVKNTLCHFPGLQSGGTVFEIGVLTCGTLKTIKYSEISTGNTNTFKALVKCK
ncbi:MAG: hypothetical protein H0X03_09040 [Nitrosopumilus sp.]|nr:hypothetical protein [Nitrosopumilus sp.]